MTNKYSELSDFEINDEVVESLCLYHLMYYSYDPYYIIWDVASNDLYNGFLSKKGIEFNPCGDYSIAFKIMIDNKISLTHIPLNNKWEAVGKFGMKIDGSGSCNYSLHKNPCRSIAECYLLIKDAENG